MKPTAAGRRKRGAPPRVGDVVELDGAASPEFARSLLRMEITTAPEASSIDALSGRGPRTALWILLTGWELDQHDRRQRIRTVSARRQGIRRVLP